MTYAYIVVGAVLGAPLRYFVAGHIQNATASAFPWGTLLVNVTGCLAIGFILGLAEERDVLSREARLLLVTGFLGSYTTFSSFGFETYNLARIGEAARAAGYVGLSVVAGLAAVWLGAGVARVASR